MHGYLPYFYIKGDKILHMLNTDNFLNRLAKYIDEIYCKIYNVKNDENFIVFKLVIE